MCIYIVYLRWLGMSPTRKPQMEWGPYHYEAWKSNPSLQGWPCYPKQGYKLATQQPPGQCLAKKRNCEVTQNRNQHQAGVYDRSS